MRPKLLVVVFAETILAAGIVAREEKPVAPEKLRAEGTRLQRLLDERLIDPTPLNQEMTLAKLLAAVEGQLKERKVALSLDEVGLGKDLPRVADAAVALKLGKEMVSLRSLLAKALRKPPVEVDYALRTDGVVITRPRLAAHRSTYLVGDVSDRLPGLMPRLQAQPWGVVEGVKPTDGEALLVRLLMNAVELREWESVEAVNRARLVVIASPARHAKVESLLQTFRGLLDLAVVMYARLYEVDRATYTKHVAPLFAKDRKTGKRPALVSINQPVFNAVIKGKALVESEDERLRPGEEVTSLSKRSAFRYAGVADDDFTQNQTRTGLAGVSFRVRPSVSADRWFLRLEVTQEAVQLVGIEKAHRLDRASGKKVEVESPNLRRATLAGSVHLPDGGGDPDAGGLPASGQAERGQGVAAGGAADDLD